MGKRKKNNQKTWKIILEIIITICILIGGYITYNKENPNKDIENVTPKENIIIDLSTIPQYTTSPYVELNNNNPYFTEKDYTTEPFEKYSEWDELGRSGIAYANVCKETMPREGEERGEIGNIKDLSGWIQKRYDNLIKDKYLYNRCHLIGYQLTGENANEKNLITCTRYMNTTGMLPFENEVADYVKETGNHVLYRVTPDFKESNLVASGVEIEAKSIEDNGAGVSFNVYVYNVQKGIGIDYATGESHLET